MTDRPTSPIAGRFSLIDRIGGGASGTVWRAYDHRRSDYCAAKVVEQGDVRTLLRIAREQGVRLTHPNVVSPYGWVADEVVLIAMDLVRGGSLATLIGDYGPLPDHFVARVLRQLLAALAHIHGPPSGPPGLVHRDVKPANVLLDATGLGPPHARLGDFGLAMPADGPRLTQTGYVIGTRGYLPPEALHGTWPNARRDLFASGVVAWQMLTGSERPPEGAVKGPPPFEGDPALWVFVRNLMSPSPAARPRDAEAATRELDGIIGRLPSEVPARTLHGEPIEVFDVLGPLPPPPSL